MDVSQWAIDLKLAPADRDRLEGLIRSGNTPQKLVPRARIAPLSDGTRLNGAIAREVGVALPTVHRWQRRVQEQGVDGLLRDKTRPSRIPPLAPDVVERVAEMTLQEPPGEATHWSSRTMAAASGVSGTSVRRIWCKGRMKFPQFGRAKNPQTVRVLMDWFRGRRASLSVVDPVGVAPVAGW